MDVMAAYERWMAAVKPEEACELEALSRDENALADAFFRDLEFGTGGLRGVLGLGSNRMNAYTVGKATQGLANYLNAHFDHPSVALCRDSRNGGEEFVRVTAEVLAANGIRSFAYPRIEPTPALSFAVRDLGCSAGINVTASHNPAAYNGYKVYGADGCQITTQAAHGIQSAIDALDPFVDVQRMDWDEACAQGLVSWIGEDTLERYLDAVEASSAEMPADSTMVAPATAAAGLEGAAAPLKVVYTPLNGTGLECVSAILERIGVKDVTVVPEQAVPDGNFPTCPYPNPEIREALACGLQLCEQIRPDLLLATDPDADRVGVAALHEGEYLLISGNEMGMLLLDYLCQHALTQGRKLADAVAVTTIVSSAMTDALACDYGFQLRRTLTGFKYIGEQIGLLESVGQESRFLFGFEESYGYLAGTAVRDKDAVVASMLICQMAAWHKRCGRSLIDALRQLSARYGFYRNGLINLQYPGAQGAAQMTALMKGLREHAPQQIAGLPVVATVDYAAGAAMPILNGREEDAVRIEPLPAADVVEFQLEGGSKVLVRPSGTEPKIKVYLFAQGATAEEGDALLAALDASMRELMQ